MRILIEIWPAVIPLLLYSAWWMHAHRRARKRGDARVAYCGGAFKWSMLAGIGIAALLLILSAVTAPRMQGEYVPPHMEGGRVVKGVIHE